MSRSCPFTEPRTSTTTCTGRFKTHVRNPGEPLFDEHDLAEPRRNVRPRLGVLRIGPDAHAPVRLDAVPAIEIHLPDRADGGWTTRQLLEIRPWNHGLEAPAAVGVCANVQRPAKGR